MEKKNNILLVLVFLFGSLLAVACTYIYLEVGRGDGGVLIKEDKKNTNINTNKEDLNLTEVERIGLMSLIENKYNLYLAQVFPIKDINDVDNQLMLSVGLSGIYGEFTYDMIDYNIKNYFYNYNLREENIKCFCGTDMYIYDKSSHKYSINPNHLGHGGGGAGYINTKTYFVSGTYNEDRDEVELNLHVLYERYCADACMPVNSYYKNYEDALSYENVLIGDPNSEYQYYLSDNDYSNIKDKLPITTYKFKVEGGKYLLKSVNIK